MRDQTVLELRVDFKYDLEDVLKRGIARIVSAIGRWAKPAKHGRATVTFLVISNETHAEMSRRLSPALEQMDSINNFWISYAPKSAIARHGTADPYIHWLRVAWEKAGQSNQSENMRHPQRFRRFPKGRV
jgi:hypothetical protein